MPQTLYHPAAPQSIGQVLDSAFRIFEISLLRCLLYGALSMIVGQLPNIYFIAAGKPLQRFGGGDPVWVALYIIGTILTVLIFAALILRQHRIAAGERVSVGAELSEALRRLPAFVGLTILALILMGIGPLVVGVIYAMIGPSTANYLVLGTVLAVLMVPVTYLMTPLTIATPALLLDHKGPAQALRYSVRLVNRCWWRTTAIFAVALVVIVVFYAIATLLIGLALPLIGASDLAAVTAATAVVYVVLGGIGMPFFSAIILAAYGELRVRKEGLDLERRVAEVVQA